MKFRWCPTAAEPLQTGRLAQELGIPPLLAQCLVNRGFAEPGPIGEFLQPRLKNLRDPFQLPNMGAAVERLFQARTQMEPITVFGDYDVDGVTSVTLLLEVLRALGWTVNYYLPHRITEGYGLSRDGLENCLQRHPARLLLAVDCGSTSGESIAWLKGQGVDVIVLDHHQVSQPPPAALALVNPQLTASGEAPYGVELCSVGLAFKLAHALIKRGRETGLAAAADFDLRPLLDLVALGTIADLVPLTAENRTLVSAGLERLNKTQRPGLVALKEVAQCTPPLGAHEVGFQLGPRLNAAGRLETAEEALQLLLARDFSQALPLARQLDSRNRERQKLERQISEQVIRSVREKFNPEEDFVIVEGDSLWHIGVAGIVASRMVQQFYRPAIIVGGEGDEWRGSGRSIAGFDLAAALRECTDLLARHGGHAMAAGLTIHRGNVEAFRIRLNQLARGALTAANLQAPLRLDAEVRLKEMTLDALTHLAQLKPNGQGNPSPQFFSRDLCHQRPLQRMGAEKQHAKLWVTDGAITQEAVWWSAGKEELPVGRFDLAFAPQINEYGGRRVVQLKILDWRPAARP